MVPLGPVSRLAAVNLPLYETGCSAVGRGANVCRFFRWRTLNVAVLATML